MKNQLNWLMVVAAMAAATATSCSDEAVAPVATAGEEATVAFSVALPSGIGSRAYSDGEKATQLQYYVYDTGTTTLVTKGTATFSSLTADVNLQLVTGKTYDVVFWADSYGSESTTPYSFDTTTKCITVSYDGATSNDENRDAFFNHVDALKVDGPLTKTITLTRPFAQINFGTDDLTLEAVADIKETVVASVETKAYTKLNLMTGAASDEQPVTFGYALFPTGEDFPYQPETSGSTVTPDTSGDDIGGTTTTTYSYVAMNYILVNAIDDKGLVDITLNIKDNAAATDVRNSILVPNAPVRRNYRTNIYGSLLTSTANLTVSLAPAFTSMYNEKVARVVYAADVEQAMTDGYTNVVIEGEISNEQIATIPKVFSGSETVAIDVTNATSDGTLKVVEASTGTGSMPAKVIVSNNSETAINLDINLPNSTVEITSGNWASISVITADDTFIVGESVTGQSLTVNKGNVVIYGSISDIAFAEDNTTGYVKEWWVRDAASLRLASSQVSANRCAKIVMKDDIDLQGSADNKWEPIVAATAKFVGFYGEGHTISNLYVDNASTTTDSSPYSYAGFFYTAKGDIRDVTISKAEVTGWRGGILIGRYDGGTVENCTVKDGKLFSRQKNGGLIGYVSDSSTEVVIRGCKVSNVAIDKAAWENEANAAYANGGLVGYLLRLSAGALIENNTVDNITFANAYSSDDYYYMEECYSHAFVGNVVNLVSKDTYESITIEFKNNSITNCTNDLRTCDRTTDYFGWYAADCNYAGKTSYYYSNKVIVDGVVMDRYAEIRRIAKMIADGGTVEIRRYYDFSTIADDGPITITKPTTIKFVGAYSLLLAKKQLINNSELIVESANTSNKGTLKAPSHVVTNNPGATFTTNAVNIKANIDASDSECIGIYNNSATVALGSGLLSTYGCTIVSEGEGSQISINDTQLETTNKATDNEYIGNANCINAKDTKITINTSMKCIGCLYLSGSSNATITAATIVNRKSNATRYAIYCEAGAKAEITSADSWITGTTQAVYSVDEGAVKITGGYFGDNLYPCADGYKYEYNESGTTHLNYKFKYQAVSSSTTTE